MRDLATLNYVNVYAAEVEALKARGLIFERGLNWPSDAPAIPRGPLAPETHRLKAWNRRLTLLRSAIKRRLAEEGR